MDWGWIGRNRAGLWTAVLLGWYWLEMVLGMDGGQMVCAGRGMSANLIAKSLVSSLQPNCPVVSNSVLHI